MRERHHPLLLATSFLFLALGSTLACSSDGANDSLGSAGSVSGAGGATAGQGGTSPLGASAGSNSGGSSAGSGGQNVAGAAGAGTAGAGGAGGTAGGSAGQAGMDPVGEPGLRWLGRVETVGEGARFSWPGTGVTARFNGKGAKVKLKTNAADYFQIVVDDQVSLLTTQAGEHTYDWAKDLPAGPHTVTLWRRTEANSGTVELGSVTFDGELLAPPPASDKRLEIVGDSISVGFGVECQTQGEAFSYATENNYQTYQAVAARSLGAEVMTLAWSGLGMWRDVGGSTTNTQMPERYLRTIANQDGSVWDFSRYTPGAVVVHLGTNDFAQGDPGQPFVDAYIAFVTGVRGRYPQARIYLTVSPMLGGDRRTALTGHLTAVKTARNNQGDQNLALLTFAEPAADAWGCGHPNGATHQIMAGVLTQTLKQDLGW